MLGSSLEYEQSGMCFCPTLLIFHASLSYLSLLAVIICNCMSIAKNINVWVHSKKEKAQEN